jgi:hypothetical protein
MSYSEEDEEFWGEETHDDRFWAEPWKVLAARRGQHAARPRFARPVPVLGVLAGALAATLGVSAVFGWLPSHGITPASGLALADTGHLRGARAAASRTPPATVPPSPRTPPATVPPSRRPHVKAVPPRRPAAPVPPPVPLPSTRLAAAAGPVDLSLASYFNNIGVASASNQNAGNIDGNGFAFSAEALAAAGVRAGSTITYHGVQFTWPDVAAGRPDNVVASGQALRVSGAGTTLAFLVAAGWGPATGSGEVVYANGSTQKFTVDAPDWWTDCSRTTPGDVLFTHGRYPTDGQPDNFMLCVYYASVPLHAGEQVKQIVLPDVSGSVPPAGDPSLHIFAVTIH